MDTPTTKLNCRRLGKTYDFDNWDTTDISFNYLDHFWDPFTKDRFADNKKTKLTKFNSQFRCSST